MDFDGVDPTMPEYHQQHQTPAAIQNVHSPEGEGSLLGQEDWDNFWDRFPYLSEEEQSRALRDALGVIQQPQINESTSQPATYDAFDFNFGDNTQIFSDFSSQIGSSSRDEGIGKRNQQIVQPFGTAAGMEVNYGTGRVGPPSSEPPQMWPNQGPVNAASQLPPHVPPTTPYFNNFNNFNTLQPYQGIEQPAMNHAGASNMVYPQAQPSIIAPGPVQRVGRSIITLGPAARNPISSKNGAATNFHDLQAIIQHPSLGTECKGTFKQLLDEYPELKPEILARYTVWKRRMESRQQRQGGHEQNQLDLNRPLGSSRKSRKNTVARTKIRLPKTSGVPSRVPFHQHLPVASPLSSNMSESEYSAPNSPMSLNNDFDETLGLIMADENDAGFNLEHESIEAALEYLERPPTPTCEKLDIEGDDWEDLTGFSDEFKGLCLERFSALQHPGGEVPTSFSQEQKVTYAKNHANAHRQVLGLMQTAEQTTEAKARVIKAMHELVRIHEVGVPRAVLQAAKKSRADNIDATTTCKQRAQKVIDHARTSKYIALDILKSKNLAQFARSPDAYLEKKFENSGTNKTRADNIKEMMTMERSKQVTGKASGGAVQSSGSSESPAMPPIAENEPLLSQFQGNTFGNFGADDQLEEDPDSMDVLEGGPEPARGL